MLEIEGLTIEAPGAKGQLEPLIADLSFSVSRSVGLVGESGSGKSLLVHAIAGLLRPPASARGVIRFEGRDLMEARRDILGWELAILLPGGRARLNPLERVGRQVARVALDHDKGLRHKEAEARAVGLLGRVGIPDPEVRAQSYPHELSGGMAQRVLIAMALVNRPRFLVADEPTIGLDVTIQRQVLDDLASLIRDDGLGLLIVTRELGIVAQYCDRVAVLSRGRLIENAPVRRFFTKPEHPYSRRLIEVAGLERQQAVSAAAGRTQPDAGGPPKQVETVGKNGRPIPSQPLVEVRGLAKHFAIPGIGNLVALGGVNLTISNGETVGLVGESGSGKTTLGRLILRLIEPTAGEVWLRGQRISHLSDRAFRRLRPKLQMVFQDPFSSLNPRMTIRQALRDATSELALSRDERESRIDAVLEAVSLAAGLADAHPESLTGSQQQRCAVARALIMQPDLVILDEVVSNLDVMGRLEIVQLLRNVQQRFGVSYLFISHDLTAVRSISHRVAVMYLGRVVETARADELFARPVHPYTRSLLSAVLYPDPDAEAPAYTLKGEIPSAVNLPGGCPLYARCPAAEAECTRWVPELIPLKQQHSIVLHAVACRRAEEIIGDWPTKSTGLALRPTLKANESA